MPRQCSVHVQLLLKKKSARHIDELKVYGQINSMNTHSEYWLLSKYPVQLSAAKKYTLREMSVDFVANMILV